MVLYAYEAHSISAGLDYPGIGPELRILNKIGGRCQVWLYDRWWGYWWVCCGSLKRSGITSSFWVLLLRRTLASPLIYDSL